MKTMLRKTSRGKVNPHKNEHTFRRLIDENAYLSAIQKRILSRHNAACPAYLSNKPPKPCKIKEKTENTQHTYCIIPIIRAQVCNKDVKIIVQEARNRIATGHWESVPRGIFPGDFGQTTARQYTIHRFLDTIRPFNAILGRLSLTTEFVRLTH